MPSRERCAESGWYAWDLVVERPMDDAFIRALRPLGAFTCRSMLKRPFFRIESQYRFVKGLLGDDFLRVAVHDGHRELPEEAEALIRG